MKTERKVIVNLKTNEAKIITTRTVSIFNKLGIFGVEGDCRGGTRVEKLEDNKYIMTNRMYARSGEAERIIHKEEWNSQIARKKIAEVLKDRWANSA